MNLEPGMSYDAQIPSSQAEIIRIYTTHTIQSTCYPDTTLIVYKYFENKHWFEKMCTAKELTEYIEVAM